jgi:hypothetical protein
MVYLISTLITFGEIHRQSLKWIKRIHSFIRGSIGIKYLVAIFGAKWNDPSLGWLISEDKYAGDF